MLPAQERRREALANKVLGEKEFDKPAAEALGEFLSVVDREEEKHAVWIESALQDDRMPVSVRS